MNDYVPRYSGNSVRWCVCLYICFRWLHSFCNFTHSNSHVCVCQDQCVLFQTEIHFANHLLCMSNEHLSCNHKYDQISIRTSLFIQCSRAVSVCVSVESDQKTKMRLKLHAFLIENTDVSFAYTYIHNKNR